jgi:hypothetical protein
MTMLSANLFLGVCPSGNDLILLILGPPLILIAIVVPIAFYSIKFFLQKKSRANLIKSGMGFSILWLISAFTVILLIQGLQTWFGSFIFCTGIVLIWMLIMKRIKKVQAIVQRDPSNCSEQDSSQ